MTAVWLLMGLPFTVRSLAVAASTLLPKNTLIPSPEAPCDYPRGAFGEPRQQLGHGFDDIYMQLARAGYSAMMCLEVARQCSG